MAHALSIASAQPLRRAFISHATADDSYVAEMESFLRIVGPADVFNDAASIRPDEEFWPTIQQGIADSDVFICVISAASTASDWVNREIEYARNLGQRVIGVRIDDSPLSPHFTSRDVIDFRPRRRAERRIDIGRIVQYAPEELIGREAETRLLSDAWGKTLRAEAGRPHVFTFVALGGEGKTSLVAKWTVDEMLAKGWPGCDAAFAWSFYSQGTRDQVAGSSDMFLKTALDFFGDADDRAFAASPAGAYEKGQRLARVVGRQRSLLILDGLEPLQYAPTAPTGSTLKDQGITALLKGLAQQSQGLCLTTTRYSVPDLKAFRQSTATEVELLRLSTDAGTHLLDSLGVKGTAQERNSLVEDVKGHALTLNLFGSWLRDAHNGDIRQRHLVKLEEADAEVQGGHAFRVMEAYEVSFEREGDKGRRALALLRLLGLFDRPITADCFEALLKPPAIAGLTDPLVDLSSSLLNQTLNRLDYARLLTVRRELGSAILMALDAHPLLREYFARQVRKRQPDAWRAAHRRTYDHLRDTTKEGNQPALEDLQPLYHAVAHGCFSGSLHEAYGIYLNRIHRNGENYSIKKLGAFPSELVLLGNFFDSTWSDVSKKINPIDQAWMLNHASYLLRTVGRPRDAIIPGKAGVLAYAKIHDYANAATAASNLSEAELLLGEISAAIESANNGLFYANKTTSLFHHITRTARLANAIHQAGRHEEAHALFNKSKQIELRGQDGFQYCDLLLSKIESRLHFWRIGPSPRAKDIINSVQFRAHRSFTYNKKIGYNFELSLDMLTMGKVKFYRSKIINTNEYDAAVKNIQESINGFKSAGTIDYLPAAILARAWVRATTGTLTGPDSAQSDLNEAWDIAERGPMRLHMADIHLYRARLFFREARYPWESPEVDLAAARKLIDDCGYGRRREELEDAEAALAQWRQRPVAVA